MTLAKRLEAGHAVIDEGVATFAQGWPDRDRAVPALQLALDELRRHISFEEELLFPQLDQAGLVPPLIVMRREHGELWATMTALVDGLSSGADPASSAVLVEQLMGQLQVHNQKEEMIIYPAAEGMLSPSAQEELTSMLDSFELSEGWVCEAAR